MMELCVEDVSKTEPLMAASHPQQYAAIDALLVHKGQLRRIIAGMGLGRADADDILQDVSLKAIASKDKFASESRAMAWLIRVTINCCILEFRKSSRFKKAADKIFGRFKKNTQANDPHAASVNAEHIELIRNALKKLDKQQLEPLVLKYFSDYNSVQIAEALDLKPSTARSRIRNARLALAKTLVDKGVEL